MNKRLLYGIITLLAFTLAGILGFQYFWLKNTIRLETESFDRKVYDITQRVNQQLEEKEAREMVKNDITRLIASSDPQVPEKPVTEIEKAIPQKLNDAKSNRHKASSSKQESNVSSAVVEPVVSDNFPPRLVTPSDFHNMSGFPEFDGFTRLKEFEPLLQLGLTNHLEINQILREFFPDIIIRDSQIVVMNNRNQLFQSLPQPVYKKLDSLKLRRIKAVNQQVSRFLRPDFIQDCTARCVEEDANKPEKTSAFQISFSESSKVSPFKNEEVGKEGTGVKQSNTLLVKNKVPNQHKLEQEAAEKARLKAKTLDLEMKKVMVNYFSGQKNIKERIDSAEIQRRLANEFKKSGIEIPFDFAVYRGHQQIYQTIGLQPNNQEDKIYTAGLFTNDVVDSKLRLFISFPDKDTYIIQNLYALVWVSGALSLLILTTFFASAWALLRQKKVSDIKSDFINNMTHEFKTPIATISLATDALKNPKVYQDQDRIQYYSGIIREENKRMNKQVEKVLQMAQLERKDLQLNKEPLCIHDVIQQAVSMLSLQVEDRGGKIETYFSAEDCLTSADEVHLANVFFNLIDNANKYTDTQPEIKLYTYNHQDRIIIEVTDNGKGMKPETIRHCFDKFYRESTGNRHDVKGFGLGLSYVKEIVDMHHGDIRVKSELNEGTTFEISLPLCKTNRN